MPKSKEGLKIRLQKYIADCGVTSRRKAEQLIEDGRVEVNGEITMTLGTKVLPGHDTVAVDGNIIDKASIDKEYIVLNKPRGYVTTLSDPEGRKTVRDLLPMIKSRVYPVGRLDYHSEGLLILTNDGEVANMIMHPRYNVTKVYEVKVFGIVNEAILKKLRKGINTEEGKLQPKSVRIVKFLQNKTWLEFRLNEGRNREIRKICEANDLTVDKLRRVAIEGLDIQGVAPGNHLYLKKHELLKKLNLNNDGSKRSERVEFQSTKRTAKFPKKRFGEFKSADDKEFTKYRKENYQETIALQKKIRAQLAEKAAQESGLVKPNKPSKPTRRFK